MSIFSEGKQESSFAISPREDVVIKIGSISTIYLHFSDPRATFVAEGALLRSEKSVQLDSSQAQT